jgi:hypothetical protein
MTPKAFHALFGRIGERAKMPFPVHPHILRHGCGYAGANVGHDTKALQAWLGHRNIQHTVRCTEVAPDSSRTSGGRLDVVPGRGRSAYPPVQNDSGLPKDLRALPRHPEPGVSCQCGVKSRPADAQKFEDRVGGWLDRARVRADAAVQ